MLQLFLAFAMLCNDAKSAVPSCTPHAAARALDTALRLDASVAGLFEPSWR